MLQLKSVLATMILLTLPSISHAVNVELECSSLKKMSIHNELPIDLSNSIQLVDTNVSYLRKGNTCRHTTVVKLDLQQMISYLPSTVNKSKGSAVSYFNSEHFKEVVKHLVLSEKIGKEIFPEYNYIKESVLVTFDSNSIEHIEVFL